MIREVTRGFYPYAQIAILLSVIRFDLLPKKTCFAAWPLFDWLMSG